MDITIVTEVKKRGVITIREAERKALNIHEGTILVLKIEEVINKEDTEVKNE